MLLKNNAQLLSRISVEHLNREAKKNNIWCFGCGKRLYEMLNLYQNEPFVSAIKGLFDNNRKLFHKEKEIINKKWKIYNPDDICKINGILLITSDYYNDIYDSIKAQIIDSKIQCYIYPLYYYDITSVLMRIMKSTPVKRQILFYAGDEPHENADEIIRYLDEEYKGKKYKIVILQEKNESINRKIKVINKWTPRNKTSLIEVIRYCILYASSKYLIYENESLEKVGSRQKLIYLNHGTLPLKDVKDVLKQPEELDYAVCPGIGCREIYKEQYGIPYNKQIYMMLPRVHRVLNGKGGIDLLVNSKNNNIILWLPTFRQLLGSSRVDSNEINPLAILKNNIYELDRQLKLNGQMLVIKKHPREKSEILINKDIENIYILEEKQLSENGLILQDLFCDTVALITDYSSIAFEYMLLDKPIGYILDDIDEYFRGFSVSNPLEYMPGEKIKNIESLFDFLNGLKNYEDKYKYERENLIQKLFGENAYSDGTERFISFLDGEKDEKILRY